MGGFTLGSDNKKTFKLRDPIGQEQNTGVSTRVQVQSMKNCSGANVALFLPQNLTKKFLLV